MGEKPAFPNFDWRFNEFPNANSHALYVTCMELMALPSQPKVVGNALLNILLTSGSEDVPRKNVMGWINAIALVLTSLPECYWEVIQEHILQTLRRNPQMSDSIPLLQQDLKSIFSSYDFVASYTCQAETMPAYLMAITHAQSNFNYPSLFGFASLTDASPMGEKPAFPNFDWRFNEFPNANSHALYVTCMELMALPSQPKVVGNALLNILLTSGSEDVPRKNVMGWINAIALVLTSLPECYWEVIQEHILQTLRRNPQMSDSIPLLQQDLKSIFSSYDFVASYTCQAETMPAYLMAITHAVWHHSNIGQLTLIPRFLKEQVKPIVKTEGQFLLPVVLSGLFYNASMRREPDV
ncbi:putative mediator of RNA polymerase II transcription subunit 23 [Apostichopus japonicus]|uniref:Mediator of RNA polymerase II transcription subunit 23 n=1 Tax=Stichopus japonicus TaxID=307972 RepID=A0A2G8KML8_STIJA|nr:putative mediator of RNA polymerase II transcription subunit 23 [Apostichopus japonicus]